MNATINPATWASWDLRMNDKQFNSKMQNLLSQLSQFAQQTQQAIALLQAANGVVNSFAGVTSSTTSVSCTNARTVTLRYQLNTGIPATWTLTLTNVPIGAPLSIKIFNNSGGAVTTKIAMTDSAGGSLSVFAVPSGGVAVNMTTTGRSLANTTNAMYLGQVVTLASVNTEMDFMAV